MSLFMKIVRGEIRSEKIAETDRFLAFLDIMPLAEGHTLVIPKQEIDYIFDVEDDLYSELWLFSKGVAHAIRQAIPCRKVGVSVVGLEVPHAHIHLIPINSVQDMNFSKPKLKPTPDELAAVAARIRSHYNV